MPARPSSCRTGSGTRRSPAAVRPRRRCSYRGSKAFRFFSVTDRHSCLSSLLLDEHCEDIRRHAFSQLWIGFHESDDVRQVLLSLAEAATFVLNRPNFSLKNV